MKNWTNMEKQHQAKLEYYCGPFDTTFGNDMQNEATEKDFPPLTTPTLERVID